MQELGEDTIAEVLGSLQYATEAAPGWAKAWHNWALFNVQVKHYTVLLLHTPHSGGLDAFGLFKASYQSCLMAWLKGRFTV